MEGVLGVINFFPCSGLLELMHEQVAHRGVLHKLENETEGIALGQLSKNSKKQTVEVEGISACSDCRLDNRQELVSKLRLGESEVSDNLLCILAYKEWGPAFADELRGDFVIVIWDRPKGKVYLVRDCTGVRPLYYAKVGERGYAFASEPKALLCLPSVSKKLNFSKIEAYLSWPTDHRVYSCETFFESILSVRPAGVLEIDLSTGSVLQRDYWKIDSKKFEHLSTDSDFADTFKELFEQAVSRRLKVEGQVAAHLSGGLDSSSISTVAQTLLNKQGDKLSTLHYLTGHAQCDESEYAEEILSCGAFRHFWIQKTGQFEEAMEEFHGIMDQPDPFTIPIALYRKQEFDFCKKHGIYTILTGHDGDTTVDNGISQLISLLYQSKLKEYKSVLTEILEHKELTRIYPEWNNWPLAKKRKQYTALIYDISLQKVYYRGGLWRVSVHILKSLMWQLIDLPILLAIVREKASKLLPHLKKKKTSDVGSPKKHNAIVPHSFTAAQREHLERISCAGLVESNEVMDLTGSQWGIRYSHPFQDRDLIEYCLCVPLRLKLYKGYGRGSLRLAMKGILPEKVRLRSTKIDFSPLIKDNLLAVFPQIIAAFDSSPYGHLVDRSLIRSQQGKTSSWKESIKLTKRLQRAYFLLNWLKIRDQK